MKQTLLALAVALAVPFSMPVAAQQGPTADKAAAAKAAEPNTAEFDKQLAQVQEQMRQMQAQMDRMRTTQDPQERQKLLQEHWVSMQAAMTAMHGMWGPGNDRGGCCMGGAGMMMNGPMMGWGHMRGYYSKLTPEQLKQRQYMMDQYLPMQQMMMNHMMWHQQWMNPTPAPIK